MDWDRAARALDDERLDRDWTRQELADLAGVDVDTVADFIAREVRQPRDRTLMRLEDALGWPRRTLGRIARGEEPPTPLSEMGLEELAQVYPGLRLLEPDALRRLEVARASARGRAVLHVVMASKAV